MSIFNMGEKVSSNSIPQVSYDFSSFILLLLLSLLIVKTFFVEITVFGIATFLTNLKVLLNYILISKLMLFWKHHQSLLK